jgi:hypothetical protein
MSLYREAGSRRGRTAAAVAGLLLAGAVVGFVLGWALKPQPTLADRIEDVQGEVRPALDALELVPLHYESSNPVTKRAATEQLAAARNDVEGARDDLRALDPAGAARVEASLDELAGLLDEDAPTARVEAAVRSVERELRSAARLD